MTAEATILEVFHSLVYLMGSVALTFVGLSLVVGLVFKLGEWLRWF